MAEHVRMYHPKTKAVIEDVHPLTAEVYKKKDWTTDVPKSREQDPAQNTATAEAKDPDKGGKS
jgi:hypothetical protein